MTFSKPFCYVAVSKRQPPLHCSQQGCSWGQRALDRAAVPLAPGSAGGGPVGDGGG